jgi:phosphatidylglycerol:prolipoprotein diacylglycerol transferase
MYPTLFKVGSIGISSFSVMVIIAFLVAYKISEMEFRRRGFEEGLVDTLLIACIIGGLVGAKVLFLFQNATISELISNPLRYLSSGLTFFGGFIGATILIWLITWKKKLDFWSVLDAIAPSLTIAYSIGRIGCFLVGDDYGTPSSLPWAVAFPQGAPPTTQRVHPTQIYETIAMAVVFAFLWRIRKQSPAPGWLTGITFVLMGIERFLIEFIRTTTPSFIPGLSQAQLISIALVAIGFFKFVKSNKVVKLKTKQ